MKTAAHPLIKGIKSESCLISLPAGKKKKTKHNNKQTLVGVAARPGLRTGLLQPPSAERRGCGERGRTGLR